MAQRLALEVFANLNAELDEPPTTSPVPLPVALDVLVQRMKEDAEEYENRMRRRAFADAINSRWFNEHYTPIPAKETDQ